MSAAGEPTVFQDPDLTPGDPTRSLAAEARALSENEAFKLACANLTKHYIREFCALDPRKLGANFPEACVRAQLMVNVVGDVTNQLRMLADHFKVDDAQSKRTMTGGRP